jgi:hypothetical protein
MAETAGGRILLSTYGSYQLITRDMTRSIANVARQPMVERETAYYLENITKVKRIEDFVGNERLFRYAMKAHGLGDMAYAKAFMVKVLEGGVDNPESFANKLTDKRYRQFAETFNFARHGETATIFTKTRQGTVDLYLRQTLEEDAGRQNEGVRLALYFERKAGSIANAYEILADPALAKVVRTALNLPEAFATIDVDKQAALLEERLDFETFNDPHALSRFLERFTTLWEVNNPGLGAPQSPILALFGQPAEFGVSTELLLTMQKLKG